MTLRLVAYPHQQTFYADVFIQRLPMQTSYPSPADLESLESKLSGVIEQAESGDIG